MDGDVEIVRLKARLDLLETQNARIEERLKPLEEFVNPELEGLLSPNPATMRDMIGSIREMMDKAEPAIDLRYLLGALVALKGNTDGSDGFPDINLSFVCGDLGLHNLDDWIAYLTKTYAGGV